MSEGENYWTELIHFLGDERVCTNLFTGCICVKGKMENNKVEVTG
jgi:hypothetical protein